MKKFAVLGLLAACVLTSLPAGAQDRGYYGLGGGQRPGAEFFAPDRGRDRGPERWNRGGYRDRDEWRGRGGCSPRDALRKADRMGIRRAEIVDVGRRSIEIIGRSRGERVWVVFGRAPHCPLIS
ncbi:hypothetical protein PZ895_09885 [Mesorhizobium sp. YIM 152430]|uniref:hypothetical protein n=1 Tax=Mesorhizobium sp. YIM 152430 TaxID=3031761 RepID=UPI0023DC2C6A|nr:hypothetical protein [Mesorhizobium sp. YIM 152430]MDF1600088.1 hypothetical protein [Mesorhizobium sp. YIM 152430]